MSRYFATLIICFQLIFPAHLMAQENQNNETLERPTCNKSTKNSILNQLSLIVAANLGTKLPYACKPHGFKTPSIIAYSSGALVYILSEILASAKVKKDSNEIVSEFQERDNQAQRDAIEAQNRIDQANLKALRTRIKGQTIMKIAGSIATALAVVESLPFNIPLFSGACGTKAIEKATEVTTEAATEAATEVATNDIPLNATEIKDPAGNIIGYKSNGVETLFPEPTVTSSATAGVETASEGAKAAGATGVLSKVGSVAFLGCNAL